MTGAGLVAVQADTSRQRIKLNRTGKYRRFDTTYLSCISSFHLTTVQISPLLAWFGDTRFQCVQSNTISVHQYLRGSPYAHPRLIEPIGLAEYGWPQR